MQPQTLAIVNSVEAIIIKKSTESLPRCFEANHSVHSTTGGQFIWKIAAIAKPSSIYCGCISLLYFIFFILNLLAYIFLLHQYSFIRIVLSTVATNPEGSHLHEEVALNFLFTQKGNYKIIWVREIKKKKKSQNTLSYVLNVFSIKSWRIKSIPLQKQSINHL